MVKTDPTFARLTGERQPHVARWNSATDESAQEENLVKHYAKISWSRGSLPSRMPAYLCGTLILLVIILASFGSLSPRRPLPFKLTREQGQRFMDVNDLFHRPGTTLGSMLSHAFLDGNSMTCSDLRKRMDLTKIKSTTIPPAELQKPYFGMGRADLYGEDAQRCVTYADRFSRYTDQALGINYRTVSGANVKYERHPLYGFRQPAGMERGEWEQEMKNHNRLFNTRTEVDGRPIRMPDWQALIHGCGRTMRPIRKGDRTAVVLRYFEGAVWTEDEVLTARAMISELILARPELGWGLVIMVEIPDDSKALLLSERQEEILSTMLPKEFWPFVHFWNSNMARTFFPGIEQKGPWFDRYSYKRDCLFAEQVLFSFPSFAARYDYVQNVEADTRFIGDFRTLFESFQRYATAEPLDPTLRRYHHIYVPSSEKSQREFDDSTRRLQRQPRGQPADLIVHTPFWDTAEFPPFVKGVDLTNYAEPWGRVVMSSIANFKMSRRLVQAYTNATLKHGKTMYCETWPGTVVLHSNMAPSKSQTFETQQELDDLGGPLKAVHPPHPIRFEDNSTTLADLEEVLGDLSHDFAVLFKGSYNYKTYWERSYFYNRWRLDGTCDLPYLVHPVKNTW